MAKFKSFKSFTESIVNEAEVRKPRGLEPFANDMKEEGRDVELHLATFDGRSFKAQSTDKTWDDGVPVTKNFSRGGYKSVTIKKGEHWIIEVDTFWYILVGRTWYAVKREQYGTPPFDY